MTIGQALKTAVELHDSGRFADAEVLYRRILAVQPDHAEALHYLALIAYQAGQNSAAVELVRRAIAIHPKYAEAYSNLGLFLLSMEHFDEGIQNCREAVRLGPGSAIAHYSLGVALHRTGQRDEAIAAYRRAVAIWPQYAKAFNNLATVLDEVGKTDEAITAYRLAVAFGPEHPTTHSNLLIAMHYQTGVDLQSLSEEHKAWNKRHAEPLKKFIRPHLNLPDPAKRLRVAYLSPDLRDHPVGRFLLPVLTHHDKSLFEIFAYSHGSRPDAITSQLVRCTDCWRDISMLTDAQAAELIRQDQIDILIDLAMHSAGNRLLIFALKPAPVQISYLAYCSGTGLETIDYRLSDPYLELPGQPELAFGGKTICLPETYWCYRPGIITPSPGNPPVTTSTFITFACLNNFCKVSLQARRAWAKILNEVPASRLLLHTHSGDHRRSMLEFFEQEGIPSRRLEFSTFLPIENYFELYRQIDIALDPFPFNGGTTTCDASWMGVPTVSLAGRTGVGRAGLSILSNIGLPELVAHSEEDYVRIAISLARDPGRLSHLRSCLRGQMERSSLMDAPRFTRNIENAYRETWQQWCKKPALESDKL